VHVLAQGRLVVLPTVVRWRVTERPDPLQTIEANDFIITTDPGNGEWCGLAYWRAFEGDGQWEIDTTAATLRELLCNIITHPRFGQ